MRGLGAQTGFELGSVAERRRIASAECLAPRDRARPIHLETGHHSGEPHPVVASQCTQAGPVAPDPRERVPGRSRRRQFGIEERDRLTTCRQVVGDRGADDAGTHDDDLLSALSHGETVTMSQRMSAPERSMRASAVSSGTPRRSAAAMYTASANRSDPAITDQSDHPAAQIAPCARSLRR